MDTMWTFITDFFVNIGAFWLWLQSPIDALGGFKPLELVGVTGIAFLVTFWVARLIRNAIKYW